MYLCEHVITFIITQLSCNLLGIQGVGYSGRWVFGVLRIGNDNLWINNLLNFIIYTKFEVYRLILLGRVAGVERV